jgi:uncharacterized membrane protein YhhN
LDTLNRKRTLTINYFWLALTLALAGADWTAVWRGWKRVTYITKPGTLLALIGLFSFASGWQGNTFWFGLALAFSLLGDVFLLFPRYFMAGFGAFLLAHGSYIIGFNPNPIPVNTSSILLVVAVWAVAMLLFRRLSAVLRMKENGIHMQWPVMIYSLAVSVMLLSAVVTLVRPEWLLPAACMAAGGGLLFFTSDTLLAFDRFIHPIAHARLLVRIPYHVGQILIITGVLLNYHKL